MRNCLNCDYYEKVPPGLCPDCGARSGDLHADFCQRSTPKSLFLLQVSGKCHRYPNVIMAVPSDYWCGEHIRLGTFDSQPSNAHCEAKAQEAKDEP